MKSQIQSEFEDPFKESDINIIQNRNEEEKRRIEAREQNQKLKIWDERYKHQRQSRKQLIQNLFNESNGEGEGSPTPSDARTNLSPTKPTKSCKMIVDKIEKYLTAKGILQEPKESLPDFIAKKKELFLLQMSLNIKKEEIEKLDEKAQQKEEMLRKSEKILEEDALRFDIFLKENDKKAQEAWREAEKETKKKMEKIQEIKKLNQQLQTLQSTINKHNDNLEECLQYKRFLDDLTPKIWVENHLRTKRERQEGRRRARVKKRQEVWKTEQEKRIEIEQRELEEKAKNERKKKSKRRLRRNQHSRPDTPLPKITLPPMPDFDDDELLTSSDEEIPMYFEQPQQLLEIYSNMEEENLFLIQNMQEAEQSLDEMSNQFQASEKEVQEKVNAMKENIDQLKSSVDKKKADLKAAVDLVEGRHVGFQRQEEDALRELTKKVKEVYQTCGFSDAGSTPSALFMLSEIETSMEEILSRIETMPVMKFKQADKHKEKKRREEKRAQQQAKQAKLQEERNRKVIERSMQPPKKQTGKKVVYVSKFSINVITDLMESHFSLQYV